MPKKKLDYLGVSAFCESMAMMTGAGIRTDEAISLLQDESRDGGILAQGLEEMKPILEEGGTLSGAMARAEIFPDFAVRMVAAGERSGLTEDVLSRLARYYADQKTILEKLRGAVAYPASMLLLIIAVLATMLTVVLPAFRAVYDRMTGSLAASSYAYIRLAGVICAAALIVMALLALALLVGLLLWRSGRRDAVSAVLDRFPRCRAVLETRALFRFFSAVETFLASGELQDDAVRASIPMVGSKQLEKRLNSLAERMDKGKSLAQAVSEERLLEPVYSRMLLAGQRGGSLEEALARVSGLLKDSCAQHVERLVDLVAPLLSGVLMLTVALALISVMLPLIGMMNAIG